MMQKRKSNYMLYFHVHLISDSTGETLVGIMRASCAQFENIFPLEHLYVLVRKKDHMEQVIQQIRDLPGIVMYTLVDEELRNYLETICQKYRIKAIAVMDPILSSMARYLGAPIVNRAGAQRIMDTSYFVRMEALDFAINYDDGNGIEEMEKADIVLIGVSRTSKTPTCVYLAHRGYKAANIPIVPGIFDVEKVKNLKNPLIVGLIASPEKISFIRRNRLLNLHEKQGTDYIDVLRIKKEIQFTKRLCLENNWPLINVTNRSVEETAAKIISYYTERKEC